MYASCPRSRTAWPTLCADLSDCSQIKTAHDHKLLIMWAFKSRLIYPSAIPYEARATSGIVHLYLSYKAFSRESGGINLGQKRSRGHLDLWSMSTKEIELRPLPVRL